MRILITGGSGFIGTNLLEYFIQQNHEVCNFDIVEPRNSAHYSYWHKGDLLELEKLQSAILEFSPQIIFHLAARTDLNGHSIDDYPANTTGVKNLITAIQGVNSLERIIFASSRLVCKIGYVPKDEFDYCPTTPYGESKVIGEEIVRNASSSLKCLSFIVRPTSIWGPWFDVPYKNFFLTISNSHYVHPGEGSVLKSFGFVGNTVYCLDRLMNASKDVVANQNFYLADYPPINLKLFAIQIQQKIGVNPIKTLPIFLLRAIACFGDFLKFLGWKNPPLTSFRLSNLITPMVYDTAPLETLSGDLPYSMEEGVDITINWLRTQGDI
ncbi:NAD(P)-dependent oxidoreductase [Polynucleobacter sp. JS-JIR-II-b4]|uniref:NAD-dependent epimerase/dehydratase family protein n=1 Tax=Polynucleobacter sp. JS-JIR-II-b4 TaxID=1758390 RepID=UPI001BFDA840|nr:NAD(P)-dependent oxidoreductase [Polynucleobacter sp. JS-JIR-II-b4]QWE02849.1 NAD(P)-dependent oxidoreductase [Polynucleobacter sp. JS-JIR-II-b4]